jgi:peptidoglycan hydrolase-like protein with peptidoglycan-binding domain
MNDQPSSLDGCRRVTSAWRRLVPVVGVVAIALLASACSNQGKASPSASTLGNSTTTTASPPTTATTDPPTTTTTAAPPPTTTTTTPAENPKNFLQEGSTGPKVLALQQRLTALGYWLGTPNGVFGDSTQQAVYALQKAAGIQRDGIVGPKTEDALAAGAVPKPQPFSGYGIEVDLQDDLVMFQTDGKLQYTLNTSTGGGYSYNDGDGTAIAETPTGLFHTYREVDGLVTDNLGQLWMPKFFTGGFAIHGDSYVPPYPASHGCVRVSNEAIEWVWAQNLDPIGTPVWVYS